MTDNVDQPIYYESYVRHLKAEIERLERHIKDLRDLREFDRADIERLHDTQEFLLKIIEANANEDTIRWAHHYIRQAGGK